MRLVVQHSLLVDPTVSCKPMLTSLISSILSHWEDGLIRVMYSGRRWKETGIAFAIAELLRTRGVTIHLQSETSCDDCRISLSQDKTLFLIRIVSADKTLCDHVLNVVNSIENTQQ